MCIRLAYHAFHEDRKLARALKRAVDRTISKNFFTKSTFLKKNLPKIYEDTTRAAFFGNEKVRFKTFRVLYLHYKKCERTISGKQFQQFGARGNNKAWIIVSKKIFLDNNRRKYVFFWKVNETSNKFKTLLLSNWYMRVNKEESREAIQNILISGTYIEWISKKQWKKTGYDRVIFSAIAFYDGIKISSNRVGSVPKFNYISCKY